MMSVVLHGQIRSFDNRRAPKTFLVQLKNAIDDKLVATYLRHYLDAAETLEECEAHPTLHHASNQAAAYLTYRYLRARSELFEIERSQIADGCGADWRMVHDDAECSVSVRT